MPKMYPEIRKMPKMYPEDSEHAASGVRRFEIRKIPLLARSEFAETEMALWCGTRYSYHTLRHSALSNSGYFPPRRM